MKPHWSNPWHDVVYVTIEELAECHLGLGEMCGQMNGESFILTKEKILEHWRRAGVELDAYILPQPSGFHDMGIRYGAEASQYLSPAANKEKIAILYKKYT